MIFAVVEYVLEGFWGAKTGFFNCFWVDFGRFLSGGSVMFFWALYFLE